MTLFKYFCATIYTPSFHKYTTSGIENLKIAKALIFFILFVLILNPGMHIFYNGTIQQAQQFILVWVLGLFIRVSAAYLSQP